MFVVNSFSELEEALLLHAPEMLVCGKIGEQLHAGYAAENPVFFLTPANLKMAHAVRRHYDIVDFRGQGPHSCLLLSRHL